VAAVPLVIEAAPEELAVPLETAAPEMVPVVAAVLPAVEPEAAALAPVAEPEAAAPVPTAEPEVAAPASDMEPGAAATVPTAEPEVTAPVPTGEPEEATAAPTVEPEAAAVPAPPPASDWLAEWALAIQAPALPPAPDAPPADALTSSIIEAAEGERDGLSPALLADEPVNSIGETAAGAGDDQSPALSADGQPAGAADATPVPPVMMQEEGTEEAASQPCAAGEPADYNLIIPIPAGVAGPKANAAEHGLDPAATRPGEGVEQVGLTSSTAAGPRPAADPPAAVIGGPAA